MVEELYEKIGGDYKKAISRMNDDERIKKYLRYFLADESYKQLEEAIKKGDCEEAFKGAHTLKGVSQNMAFEVLGKVSEEMTEELRAKNFDRAKRTFEKVEKEYKKVVEQIKRIM